MNWDEAVKKLDEASGAGQGYTLKRVSRRGVNDPPGGTGNYWCITLEHMDNPGVRIEVKDLDTAVGLALNVLNRWRTPKK